MTRNYICKTAALKMCNIKYLWIACVLFKIQVGHLPSRRQMRYCFNQLAGRVGIFSRKNQVICLLVNRRNVSCVYLITLISSRGKSWPTFYFVRHHQTVGFVCWRRQGFGGTIANAGVLQTPSSIHPVVTLRAVETWDRCYDYSVSSAKWIVKGRLK